MPHLAWSRAAPYPAGMNNAGHTDMAGEQANGRRVAPNRLWLGTIGGLAGLATWALTDAFDGTRLALFLAAFVLGAFAVFFALSGPARRSHAGLAAVGLVLPCALLFFWASFRFDTVERYLDRTHALTAFVTLGLIGTPFAAAMLRARQGWRDYTALFDIAWTIVVRYGVAWAFTGLFWLLLMLSNALLSIVGITVIEDLIDIDPVPFTLTGAALGVALAVVHELRGYISPFLVLRLLRLFLPPVLAVVIVFLCALPVRGLSNLFGGLSVAGTLMAVTLALVTLVTAAVDRDDGAAVHTAFMRRTARVAAILTPFVAVLAVIAVWLRVAQYGWTPDRLSAAVVAGVGLAYGLGYAAAVLRGAGWMARLRQVNLWMALVTFATAALWLTPLLNAERRASLSQANRFLSGQGGLDDLPLYEMAHDWGRAGEAALTRLRARTPPGAGADALEARIAAARTASSRYDFRAGLGGGDRQARARALAADLLVRPEGATLPTGALDGLSEREIERWTAACDRTLPGGAPGCIAVIGAFLPARQGADPAAPQAMIALREPGDRVAMSFLFLDPPPDRRGAAPVQQSIYDLGTGTWPTLGLAEMQQLARGDFTIAPAGVQALRLGPLILLPDN